MLSANVSVFYIYQRAPLFCIYVINRLDFHKISQLKSYVIPWIIISGVTLKLQYFVQKQNTSSWNRIFFSRVHVSLNSGAVLLIITSIIYILNIKKLCISRSRTPLLLLPPLTVKRNQKIWTQILSSRKNWLFLFLAAQPKPAAVSLMWTHNL